MGPHPMSKVQRPQLRPAPLWGGRQAKPDNGPAKSLFHRQARNILRVAEGAYSSTACGGRSWPSAAGGFDFFQRGSSGEGGWVGDWLG